MLKKNGLCQKPVILVLAFSLLLAGCFAPPSPVPSDPGKPPEDIETPDEEEPAPDPDLEKPDETELLLQGLNAWERTDLPPFSFLNTMLAGDRLLLFSEAIVALDVQTGETLWSRNLAGDGFKLAQPLFHDIGPILSDNTLTYPLIKNGTVYIEQVNVSTGKTIWLVSVGKDVKYYTKEDELLTVISGDYLKEQHSYYQFGTGRHLAYLGETEILCYRGSHYIISGPSGSFILSRFNTLSGDMVWESELESAMSSPQLYDAIPGVGDIILLTFVDFDEYSFSFLTTALNNEDGKFGWMKKAILVGALHDKAILLSGDNLSAVNIDSGKEAWMAAGFGEETVVLLRDEAVYISDHSLRKIDLNTGKVLWRKEMPEKVSLYQGDSVGENLNDTPILWALSEGNIAPDYFEQELLAFNPQTGALISSLPFEVSFDSETWPIALTTDKRGAAFVLIKRVLGAGAVTLVDAQTGELVWEYSCPQDYSNFQAFAVDGNDLVVITQHNADGEVEVLYFTKQTGEKLHHFQIDGYPGYLLGRGVLVQGPVNTVSLVFPPE